MKATEFWFWKITDEFGRRRKSPCGATAENALSMWGPSATRIDYSLEVRMCPETDAELSGLAPASPPQGSVEQQLKAHVEAERKGA